MANHNNDEIRIHSILFEPHLPSETYRRPLRTRTPASDASEGVGRRSRHAEFTTHTPWMFVTGGGEDDDGGGVCGSRDKRVRK